MNKAEQVETLLIECVADKINESTVTVDGIIQQFTISTRAVGAHKDEIRKLLDEMPLEFHSPATEGGGGGWSFLNLCNDREGVQWAEHRTMEALIVLGIAAGMASYLLPKEMWQFLPGGVPYVAFNTVTQNQSHDEVTP